LTGILFSLPSSPELHRVLPLLQFFPHVNVYMIMFVFVYMFIFWIYLPHMRENMQPLSLWIWITSLNMMISSSIHLLASNIISFFLVAE
jgi:hypothetical protein